MDAAGVMILLAKLADDCAVAQDAAQKADLRLREQLSGSPEACAYELARFYNVLEKMLERICREFENRFEKQGDDQDRLIKRLSLNPEGIRHAFIPRERVSDVRELKGFRHVFHHACDLKLRLDRLAELVTIAGQIAAELPAWCEELERKVRTEQGWPGADH